MNIDEDQPPELVDDEQPPELVGADTSTDDEEKLVKVPITIVTGKPKFCLRYGFLYMSC